MTKEKKARTQYNWKFKENESEAFYQWFDKQDNISNSLRIILYHIIELYGNEDILDPAMQKHLVKDSLILESLTNKDVFSINHELIFGDTQQHVNEVPSESLEEKSNPPIVSEEEGPIHTKNEEKESGKIMEEYSKKTPQKTKVNFKSINKDLL